MDMGAKSINDPARPSSEAQVHREGDTEHLHEHEHLTKHAMEAACRGEQRMKKNQGKIPGTRIFSK